MSYRKLNETLRRWLLAAGLWKGQRKRPQHRKWRERKAHFGELVQMDDSHHTWFDGQEDRACLMDMVDDATGKTLALMSQEETTVAAMRVLWVWVERYGIPKALYVDWKIVSQSNLPPAKRRVTVQEHLDGSIHTTRRKEPALTGSPYGSMTFLMSRTIGHF